MVDESRGHVRLSSSLIGQNVTLHCSAFNVVDSQSHSVNSSVTFLVLGQLRYNTLPLSVRLSVALLCSTLSKAALYTWLM